MSSAAKYQSKDRCAKSRKTIYRPTRVYTITNNDYERTIDKQR